jgi:hypothetical protein
MKNKQKQARVSHLFRKRKSIWYALLEKDEAARVRAYEEARVRAYEEAWVRAYEEAWDGMAKRDKQKP